MEHENVKDREAPLPAEVVEVYRPRIPEVVERYVRPLPDRMTPPPAPAPQPLRPRHGRRRAVDLFGLLCAGGGPGRGGLAVEPEQRAAP